MEILGQQLRLLLGSLSRVIEDGSPSQSTMESVLVGADRVHYILVSLLSRIPGIERNLPLIESVIHALDEIALTLHVPDAPSVTNHLYSGERGRPRLDIGQDMLEYLIGSHFTVPQVAQLLHTSTSTVRRRMREFGITVRSTYSAMDNDTLDGMVLELQHRYPNCGFRLLKGHLAALGHRIQEHRIRESLRRVDPIGIMSRWIQSVQRRR